MQVLLCDVGPRDGLQNEPDVLPPETRAELVDRLAAAGLSRIEAVSFVRADRVPQMAHAEEVIDFSGVRRLRGLLEEVLTAPSPGRDATPAVQPDTAEPRGRGHVS